MPGVVGLVRYDGNRASLGGALDALEHLPGYVSRTVELSSAFTLGQVWRSEAESVEGWWHDGASGTVVLISGTVILPGPPARRLGTADLFDIYTRDGQLSPEDYDGTFVIVLLDGASGILYVWNDRVGSLPVHYTHNDTVFAFGPEVKSVLPAAGLAPQLSSDAAIDFVARGYCVGQRTLFRGVNSLEPGSQLTAKLGWPELDITRRWKMGYRPSKHLTRRSDATAAMHEAILAAHRGTVLERTGDFDLLLSGGLDSRGNLGALAQIDRPPRRNVAWGERADLQGSDPFIADALSRRFNIPFHFIRYDTSEFLENASDWCYVSELANDNIGWFAEGTPVLIDHYRTGAAFLVTGDEPWGVGGHVGDEAEARAAVMPASLSPSLRGVLRTGRLEACERSYSEGIERVMGQCDSDDWLDVKDFLYVHGRLARFVFSLGYYKEIAVEIRRPFLSRSVLEVVQGLPGRHRTYKNTFVSMLNTCFPEVMDFPDASIDSLPDWEYDIRTHPAMRQFFLELLDVERVAGGVLGEVIDPDAFRGLVRSWFDSDAAPMPRVPEKDRGLVRWLPSALRRRSRTLHRVRKLLRRGTLKRDRTRFDTLRSIALLSMLERDLDRFGVSRGH